MKLLIDTNILIPLEPLGEGDLEARTKACAEMVRHCQNAGVGVHVHEASLKDIARDKDAARRRLREQMIEKYAALPNPPAVSPEMTLMIGNSVEGTNSWVDDQLLAAIVGDAVDYLVTDDDGIHKKARRLGQGDRVVTVAEAVQVLRRLFDSVPLAPPAVYHAYAYELDNKDPIFESLRKDYSGFDDWLSKCKKQHRSSLVVRAYNDGPIAALSILKSEPQNDVGLSGKVLKACCFKVADSYRGSRYGELLLKALLQYTSENEYDWLYLTALPKQERLFPFLEGFGFRVVGEKKDELVYAKPLRPEVDADSPTDAFAYHVRYGPPTVLFGRSATYIVPIRPHYVDLLFPEFAAQQLLFEGQFACGNSIQKAYLCHSNCRSIKRGDLLLFYESRKSRGVVVVGVAESTTLSTDPSLIARTVGKRTVYSFDDISGLCAKPTLAILFRQAKGLDTPISLNELKTHGLLRAAPQSIQALHGATTRWLENRIAK